MALFDIFKKKKTKSTFPENELEKCLIEGITSTEAQKDFYQKLLWNNLYILTKDLNDSDKEEQDSKNVKIGTATFEGGQIPIFTAVNRIFDKGIIKEGEVNYMGIRAQDLFDGIKGATFVLNPYSEYCKEMKSEEIEDLLNGSIYKKINIQTLENQQWNEFSSSPLKIRKH